MSESRSSPRRFKTAERRTLAVQLRVEGKTFRQIGAAMGFSEQRAHFIVTEELQRLNRERSEAASELQQLESQRLDALHAAVWEKAQAGDLDAINAVVKLMNRRAKLLGIDAMPRFDVNLSGALPPVIEEVVPDAAAATATPCPADEEPKCLPPEQGAV
jgi:hypothetical protein